MLMREQPPSAVPRAKPALFMFLAECLNLHIHARRQIELHERIHRLLRRLKNIEQPLMSADLKLLARLLIHVRRTQHAVFVLHRRQRNRPGNLCSGASRRFHDLAGRLIQDAVIVSLQPDANSFFSNHASLSLTPPGVSGRKELAASRKPRCSWSRGRRRPRFHCYCTISEIVPAPTVCPPSRIAKRRPFSIATGVMSSITRLTLSPGITISVPAGSSATPVTSVVRK